MSRRIQVSFIGKGQRAAGTPGRPRYEKVRYDFGNDHVQESSLFGVALWRHLSQGGGAPDGLLCLGTPGSSWGALLDALDGTSLDEADADALLEWAENLEKRNGDVRPEDLRPAVGRLGRVLGVPDIALEVIGNGDTLESQRALMNALLGRLEPGDRLILDITHAYRHLPVLASFMLSALHWLRGIEIESIHYGAREMVAAKGDPVPVIDLSLCADYAKASAAYASYRLTGACRELAPLFPDAREHVDRIDFFEDTAQIGRARTCAYEARQELARLSETDGDPLRREIARNLYDGFDWVTRPTHLARWLECSRRFRKTGEYAKCAMRLLECILFAVASFPHGKLDPNIYSEEMREEAREWIKKELDRGEKDAFFRLNALRNCVAHGTRPYGQNAGDVQRALGDRAAMEKLLDDALNLADTLLKEMARC